MASDDKIFKDAQKFAAQFGGFMQAAELWSKVPSMEQVIKETQGRLDKLRAEEEHYHGRLDAERNEMMAEVHSKRAAMEAEANALLSEAYEKGQGILEHAHSMAEDVHHAAHAEAEKIRQDAVDHHAELTKEIAALEERGAELTRQVADRNADLNDLARKTDEAGKQHADAVAMLAKLRATFK